MSKMRDWTFLTGDVDWQDYGAIWCRKIGRVWWVLRFENMEEWGDGAKGYHCEVLRVSNVPDEAKKSALDTVGLSMEEFKELCDEDPKCAELTMLDALVCYGTYSPMSSCESNYPDRARAQARREADEFIADDKACQKALRRPINKIGTTASEMGQGNILAGLERSATKVMSGEPVSQENSILLKMYGATNGQTLGGKCEVKLAVAGQLLMENK